MCAYVCVCCWLSMILLFYFMVAKVVAGGERVRDTGRHNRECGKGNGRGRLWSDFVWIARGPRSFSPFACFMFFLCFSYFLFFFAYVLATNERMKKQQQIKITLRCLRCCWFCILLYFSQQRKKKNIKENTNKQNENEREEQKKNYDEQRRRRRSGHVNAYLTFIYDIIRHLFFNGWFVFLFVICFRCAYLCVWVFS